MSEKKRFWLYISLLAISLSVFILHMFVFQKPDGVPGFLICITCIYLIIGSIIKLCRMSEKFAEGFFNLLDLLFWLP